MNSAPYTSASGQEWSRHSWKWPEQGVPPKTKAINTCKSMHGTYKAFFHQSSICLLLLMVFQIRQSYFKPVWYTSAVPREEKISGTLPLGAAALPLGWALWGLQGPLGQHC